MSDEHARNRKQSHIQKQSSPALSETSQDTPRRPRPAKPARPRKPPLFPVEDESPRRSSTVQRAAQPVRRPTAPPRKPPLFPMEMDDEQAQRPRHATPASPPRRGADKPHEQPARSDTTAPRTRTRQQPLFPMEWEDEAQPRTSRPTTTPPYTPSSRSVSKRLTSAYNDEEYDDDDDDTIYDEDDRYAEAADLDWDDPPLARSYVAPYPFPVWDGMFLRSSGCLTTRVLVLTGITVISILILSTLWPGTFGTRLSGWQGPIGQLTTTLGLPSPFGQPDPHPPGDYTLRGPQTLTAAQIDAILASYQSPAGGTGHHWVATGEKYRIDAAFALAFFIHESTAGTHPGWAGQKDDGQTTHNVGNIICAGYPRCYGRFRDYESWEEGIDDWYRLIDTEYLKGRNMETVADIIPVYAPATENDVDGYVNTVQRLVDTWRTNIQQGREPTSSQVQPWGNPLQATNAVMTQGYGTGTHAPINQWGAIDLALDADGDGEADPEGTQGQPIYATHAGMVTITRDSYPGGNHVWVENERYRTGYAHLTDFTVETGQWVEPGHQIGTIGSTGLSSGPHLDYQVWSREGGQWVNQNPLDFGALAQ